MKIRIRESDQTNFQVEITKKAPELRNINNYVEWQTFVKAKCAPRRLQDVFKTSSRRLPRRLQNVFKTSSRRVCKTSCNYVFKTSSRRLGRQKNVTLKTSSRRLQDVFSTSSPRRMFAGMFVLSKWYIYNLAYQERKLYKL